MKAAVAILLAIMGVVGWVARDRIAVMAAPKKQAATSRSDAAVKADGLFWQTFHNGEYEKIPHALAILTAAYIQTPNDAKTAAHIAWLHNWQVSERARMPSVPATITDDMMLARRFRNRVEERIGRRVTDIERNPRRDDSLRRWRELEPTCRRLHVSDNPEGASGAYEVLDRTTQSKMHLAAEWIESAEMTSARSF
jgi:hypothetical protein